MNSFSTLGKAISLILSWVDEGEEAAADSATLAGSESTAANTTPAKPAQPVNHSLKRRFVKAPGGER